MTSAAKWLELLKEIAPGVTRAVVLRDPTEPGAGQFAVIQAVAPSFGSRSTRSTCAALTDRARCRGLCAPSGNGGLIVTAGRMRVSSRPDRHAGGPHELPAVYSDRIYVDIRRLDFLWA